MISIGKVAVLNIAKIWLKRAQMSVGSLFNSAELIKLRELVRETTQKPRFETNYVDNKLNGRAAEFPRESN